MGFLVSMGRVLFVILFIVTGVMKLTDVTGTAQLIAPKLVIPPALSQYVIQIEATTTVPFVNLLAMGAGLVEIVCAVMIGFGLARRSFAVLLLLYVIVITLVMHDFWNLVGPERVVNLVAALKNLSLVGALLIITGFERGEPEEDHRIASYDGH